MLIQHTLRNCLHFQVKDACKRFGILVFFLQFRIYQDAKLIHTKDITSNTPSQPIESSKQGRENKNLLDLSPSDIVFYVGGYPSNFTVSGKEISTEIPL